MRNPAIKVIRETERLRLRWAQVSDAAFFLELMNDPDWLFFIGDRQIRTEADASAFVEERLIESYEQHGHGLYLVERRAGGTPLGICGLVNRDGLEHPDLGFAFLPAYRRQGLAREASQATLQYSREELGLARVLAITRTDNERSIHLLERLCFAFERAIALPGIDTEQSLYGIDLPG